MTDNRHRARRRLPIKAVTARYGDVSVRTIDRWVEDPNLGFPKPDYIRNRRYWDEDKLDDFDRSSPARHSA